MELQLIQNEQFKVRKTEYKGETWFVGRDVADILGYKNATSAITTHVEEDDRLTTEVNTPKGVRSTTIINEIGVYSLVLGSKLPEAKSFKRWICKEVIPSIRRTGAYMTDATLAKVQADPAALQELTAKLEEERAKHIETLKLVGQHEQTIKEKDALIQRKNAYFERNKPRIDFAKAVYENKTAILVGEMAKLLNQNGIQIGQNRFFQWLREKGYLQSKEGQMWNVPYQKCIESGLFIIKESIAKAKDGSEIISRTPMVTGKGQRYFISKFLETKDQEALAAITEEELKLQSETNLFAEDGNDFKPQLTADELNALDAEAEAVANSELNSNNDELEPIDNENEELEFIDAASDELEAIDTNAELEAIE
ncbi:MAG: phage antirepressor KilAC domain-containing protein [Phascolarctobacterium sp.]|nr:phage antirepressor KilAC domain-containing protein [Phascolarctobacterium sp.]